MAGSPEQSPLKRYTYADYVTWDDDKRWELIDGIPYAMAAPTTRHQAVLGELLYQFRAFLRGKKCTVFPSPVDVLLNENDSDDDERNVFQPDIVVVCDPNKIKRNFIKGAPDLVIEILSPSTRKKDKLFKMEKYRQYGVREFWMVDPEDNILDVHLLVNDKYVLNRYGDEAKVPVMVLPGCEIDLAEVFAPLNEINELSEE